jgi:1-acyl-sn-glycerol-3-phosphate acyltransferase
VAYWIMKAIISPFLYLLWPVKVEGRENVPTHGPAVLAANHQSFCDSFFLPLIVHRRVTYVDTAKEVLDSGQVLAIYPEGTRAPDERLHKGKTGVARLALGCGVPVIPVGITGTRAVQPPGSMVMRPFRTVTIRFGPPLVYRLDGTEITTGRCGEPASGAGGRPDADQVELRTLTDTLMAEIARLSGQQYVDHYAKRTHAAAAPTQEGPAGGIPAPETGA